MSKWIFVDTNVFLYAVDNGDRVKRDAARNWRNSLWASGRGRTSFQVLQEFYYQALRKSPNACDMARAEIRNLLAWRPVEINSSVLQDSWMLQDRFRLSFWDALIVAAAKSVKCTYLLTEDLQHGQDLDGLQVVNPFRVDFASV